MYVKTAAGCSLIEIISLKASLACFYSPGRPAHPHLHSKWRRSSEAFWPFLPDPETNVNRCDLLHVQYVLYAKVYAFC